MIFILSKSVSYKKIRSIWAIFTRVIKSERWKWYILLIYWKSYYWTICLNFNKLYLERMKRYLHSVKSNDWFLLRWMICLWINKGDLNFELGPPSCLKQLWIVGKIWKNLQVKTSFWNQIHVISLPYQILLKCCTGTDYMGILLLQGIHLDDYFRYVNVCLWCHTMRTQYKFAELWQKCVRYIVWFGLVWFPGALKSWRCLLYTTWLVPTISSSEVPTSYKLELADKNGDAQKRKWIIKRGSEISHIRNFLERSLEAFQWV